MGDVVQAHAVTAAADEVGVWPGELDEQLISELLSDDSLLAVAGSAEAEYYYSCHTGGGGGGAQAAERPGALVSRSLFSTYTGPTIRDIEKALESRRAPAYPSSRRRWSSQSAHWSGASSASTAAETSNKFTTRVRSCGGRMPADGYRWRKYGQKSIKNNPYPRSYYKCTSSRCGAKRHVEKSTSHPEMLVVTYEGMHHHAPQQLIQHLHDPPAPPTDHFSGAAGGGCGGDYFNKTMGTRPSPMSFDHGTGAAGVVGGVGRPSKETCGADVPGGRQPVHWR